MSMDDPSIPLGTGPTQPGRRPALRDRLRDVVGSSERSPASSGQAPEREAGQPAAVHTRSSLEAVLGGEWRGGRTARSFVVSRRFDPDEQYGRDSVGTFAERLHAAVEGASSLTPGASPSAPFVFLDLETTGLSGGAGTHAFLVGCGRFDASGAFVVEQHLLTDFASEVGMLNVVAEELADAGALVSFNGKSFDAPVIETRYLFHRLTSPCAQLPHVDVLHPARRFWGGDQSRGCTLIALEEQLLGRSRSGDVPGFEIPGRYFEFIRSGDAHPLADVLEHNRLDLLSLAAVAARLFSLVSEGADAAVDAREALALARVYERGDDDRAQAAFERALELASAHTARPWRGRTGLEWLWTRNGIRAESIRALARGARRGRRFSEAASRWRELLEIPGCPAHLRREANEALAIHHEHRERDLATAKVFALKTLENTGETAWGDAVRHRLARIERKLVSGRRWFPSLPLLPFFDSPTSEHRTSS
jgi:uncharacterized protein YprB with RNaseH-like and TPR domain